MAILGRRFEGQARRTLDFPSTSDEGVRKGKETVVPSDPEEEEEEEDEDYSEKQYPLADDKYKNLEERLAAMEIQRVSGLDFEELGLVSGIVIPPKFKVPLFAKYDGVSCPMILLRSYVRKIQPHSSNKDLWVHFFQDSLSGTQLDWFYQLQGSNIHTWEDLATAFYRQYQYNANLAPTRVQLQGMTMGTNKGFIYGA